jgi:hypothetical protein
MGRAVWVLLAFLAACGVSSPVPAPPTGVAAVVVGPIENKTGSDLVVSGDGYVAKWLGRTKRTVPDAIGRELETVLREQSFAVGADGAPRLRIVLRRFDPDVSQLAFVDVALLATLTDPDGTVRWSNERTGWRVSTAGAVSIPDAYDAAARGVARGLVGSWHPAAR